MAQGGAFVRTLWERDRDPFLDHVRWRLHLRLLLVSALAAAAFALLNRMQHGSFGAVTLPLAACLALWLLLSRSPDGNRLAVRANLALFVLVAAHEALAGGGPFPSALLALMVMPVFGVLLDGMASGGLVLLACLASVFACLALGRCGGEPLIVSFTGVAATALYAVCLAHTWIFGSLVERQRRDRQAVALTTRGAEDLAAVLGEQVARHHLALREALDRGRDLSQETASLQDLLQAARAGLPESLPRGTEDPLQVVASLRRDAHRAFLLVSFATTLVCTAASAALGFPRWQVGAILCLAAAVLLWRDELRRRSWMPGMRAFVLLCLAGIASDVWYSQGRPPVHALVFLPLLVFYAGLLDSAPVSGAVCLAALGITGWAQLSLPPLPAASVINAGVGILLPTMLLLSLAVHPLYRGLLDQLAGEELSLRLSLQAYRRAVSTLFHDLANPLAVLQSLAEMPRALRTPEDARRAARMLDRLEAVAASRGVSGPLDVASLAESARDLFRERLSAKQLRLELESGADLVLKEPGTRLRESILGNLVSNAIKYSPRAGVLRLSARRQDGHVVLALRDQGPGIPPKVLRDLARGDTPHSSPGSLGETGSGFGLLLAAGYAREAGGRLELRNAPEGGALAEVWLPD